MGSAKDSSGAVVENLARHRASADRNEAANVTIYQNEIPPFVERELQVLYECVYCTVARFDIYDSLANVSTYVASNAKAIRAVFLFRQERDEIQVLNQQIIVAEADIAQFAREIFSRYPSARVISFYALDTRLSRLPFPHQKYPALEENILFLPPTTDEYWARMSPNFRSILRRAERKMKKDFPSFRFQIYVQDAVTEDVLREIIRMAGARMAVKQKNAYIGEQHLDNLLRLIRAHGYVGVATVDGKICGGSVWYWVGRRNFLHIIAHEPRYDEYKLGNLTLLMGVLNWIGRGGRECWLMGGGHAHKSKFKAVPKYLESVVIYRSRLALLLHWRRACAATATRLVYGMRLEVRERANGSGLGGRFFTLCLGLGRSLKRLKARVDADA